MTTHRHATAITSAALALLAAVALTGCGLAHGHISAGVGYEITQDFGSRPLASTHSPKLTGPETVIAGLERYFTVTITGRTKTSEGAVTSINGVAETPDKSAWSYYLNGIAAVKGASATGLSNGDTVWWDLHDSSAVATVPAVVGSYPEPFSTGAGGQQFPTVLTCTSGLGSACATVARSLTRAGVKVADQSLGTGSGSDSLAVLVGTFQQLRGVIAAELLQGGPDKSGVYAQFVGTTGQAMELFDPSGNVAGTLHGNAGLIAATEQPGLNQPVWLVTGTTPAGVEAAARDLTAAKLHDHFAIAIANNTVMPLPLNPAR